MSTPNLLKAERAHESASLGSLALDGRNVLRELDRHFRSAADWARPTFLYLNVQEAHFPYSHPDMPRFLPGRLAKRSEIKAANRAMVERTYWNAAAYGDWVVGQVIVAAEGAGGLRPHPDPGHRATMARLCSRRASSATATSSTASRRACL